MAEDQSMPDSRSQSERAVTPSKGRVIMLSAVLLVLGGAAYLALRQHWIGSIFAHAGALGLVSLLGAVIALIAGKKGYAYWRALLWGVALPVLIGLVAVMYFYMRQGIIYCGGSVILGVSLLMILGAFLLPRKKTAAARP